MTITIYVSTAETERLVRQARRMGQDLPSFVRTVLEKASCEDEAATLEVRAGDDADDFFGVWSGRSDLADSAQWVTMERATWQSCLGRSA